MQFITILIVCHTILQHVLSFQTSYVYPTSSLCPKILIQNPAMPFQKLHPLHPLYAYDKVSESDNNDDDDIEEEGTKISPNPLGINIGSIMDPLTPQQAAELRAEAQQEINKAFQGRLDDIQQIKQQIQQDFIKSQKASQEASRQRAEEETQRLLSKIDSMTQNFLKDNQQGREELKLAARADQQMEGRGVDLGSWGKIGGMDVVTSSYPNQGLGQLLGSVGAATRSSNNNIPSDRRIIIISDDKQVSLELWLTWMMTTPNICA